MQPDDSIRTQVRGHFSTLKAMVAFVLFTQEFECDFCRETRVTLHL